MSRSRILLIAALGVVAVAARGFLTQAPETARPRDQPPPAHVAEVVPNGPPQAAASPAFPPPPQRVTTETLASITQSSEKARATAAALRHKARFPPTSRRIENNVNPIVESRAVKERLSPPGQGRKPTLVVFSSALSYEAPNPIILYAKFVRDHPQDLSLRSDAEIAAELWNAADQVVAQVELRDDGQGRDLEAGDGVFTAQLTPADEELEQWNGLIRVQVWGETVDGDRRKARTRFYYGVPSAKLTGYYRDELVDGHLRLEAEVEVKEIGEYRLEATLTGPKGFLISWAANTVALEPGVTFIPLTFWGLTLREANEPGPYALSSIALANVTYKPPQLNDAVGSSYETKPYKPEDFSSKPFDDPKLLEKAARYDARADGAPTQ
jgi:hypothetical protein